MKILTLDYGLPPNLSPRPIEPRDSVTPARLHRDTGALEHALFRDLAVISTPMTCWSLIRTRVIPARLFARKPTGGRVEVLLLRREDLLTWECLVGARGCRPARASHREWPSAEIIDVLEGSHRACVLPNRSNHTFRKSVTSPCRPTSTNRWQDPERYQTVYAGSLVPLPLPPLDCTLRHVLIG